MENQDVRLKNPTKTQQFGGALWLILIAIALVVALTLSVTRNSSKTASNYNQESARLIAATTLRQMSDLERAVQKVMSTNGCSESEISFENSYMSGYLNTTPSPTDKRCHLFDGAGGALSWPVPPAGQVLPSAPTTFQDNYRFYGQDSVNGVGPENETGATCASRCSELIALQQYVDPAVCLEYNKLVGINTVPTETDTVAASTLFTGTYTDGNTAGTRISVGTGDSASLFWGVKTACYYHSSSTVYQIYKVLLAR